MKEPGKLDIFIQDRTLLSLIVGTIPFLLVYFFVPFEYGMTLWEIDEFGFELGEIKRTQRVSSWNNYIPTIVVYSLMFILGILSSLNKKKEPFFLGSGILIFLGWIIYSCPYFVIVSLFLSSYPLIYIWLVIFNRKQRILKKEDEERKRLKKEKKRLKKEKKKQMMNQSTKNMD